MECQNNSTRYCYSCSICSENCSLFRLILFIDCKHFSICFIFFKQRKRVFLLKKINYANNLQKQRIAEEIKVCYFYTYCALCANLKFNFKVLFAFTKIIKYYLKHFIQNSIKKCAFLFPHFYTKSRSLIKQMIAILWTNTRRIYYYQNGSLCLKYVQYLLIPISMPGRQQLTWINIHRNCIFNFYK